MTRIRRLQEHLNRWMLGYVVLAIGLGLLQVTGWALVFFGGFREAFR